MSKNKSVLPFRKIHVTLNIPTAPLTFEQSRTLVEDFINQLIQKHKKTKSKGKIKKKIGVKSHSACTNELNVHNTNLDSTAAALVTLTALQTALPVAENNYTNGLANCLQSGLDLDVCLNT